MKLHEIKLGKSMSIIGVFCAAVAGGLIADQLVDTGPVVCLVDPTCRTLTKNEQEMLRPVFGNALPYGDIRVFKRPPIHKVFSEDHIGSAFFNNVYLTKEAGPQQDDFGLSVNPDSKEDVIGDDIFVHEISHVWQNQQRRSPIILDELDYYYEIKPDSVFSDFNREQQAEIIRTYFVLRREILRDQEKLNLPEHSPTTQGLAKALVPKCQRFLEHQRLLEKILPLEPVNTCRVPATERLSHPDL
ncbi:MAG: hypothetical protein ACK4NR_08880 [Micavibrio sp.]